MRIQDNTQAQETDSNIIPENVRRVHELQKKFAPPFTGGEQPVEASTTAPASRHVSLATQDMGPLPPTFGTDPSAPQQPRDKSFTPLTARKIPQQQVEDEPDTEPVKTVAKNTNKTRVSKDTSKLDARWQRVDFPSNLVPYAHLGIKEIFVRPFNVQILELIYDCIEAKNHSGYLDALDHCISMDVRELTVSDYIYLQYWLRFASYTRSPYTIKWTSRYGNEQTSVVKMTDLQITQLKMSIDEYAKWRAQGISFPTVRESEYMLSNELEETKENEWAMQNAQYILLPDNFEGDHMQEKLRVLREHEDPDIIAAIQEFSSLTIHGVHEQIEIADPTFKPAEAIKYLRDAAMHLRMLAKAGMESEDVTMENTAGIVMLSEKAEEFDKEADDIQAQIDAGKIYLPKKEVVVLRAIQPTDMFPSTDPSSIAPAVST